ncbi:MGH1-like glycoside hydrolase domain-containing protein [Mariniluteicoccus flavus]
MSAAEGRAAETAGDIPGRALTVLDTHWMPDRGWTVPHPATYPHLWLWDSAFHAIAWARLGDERAVPELEALLGGQLDGGTVPHMRYGDAGPDTFLGPLPDRSSLTQPPRPPGRGPRAPERCRPRGHRGRGAAGAGRPRSRSLRGVSEST